MGILHLFLGSCGIFGMFSFIKNFKSIKWSRFDELWGASFIGGGLALTLLGLKMYPHYIICSLPFSYYFAVRLFHHSTPWLTKAFVISQFILTSLFLTYVVKNNGIIGQEYGKSYQGQINDGTFNIKRDKTQFHLKMKH